MNSNGEILIDMFSQIPGYFMFCISFPILDRSLRLPAARIRNHGSPSCWSARSSPPRSRTVACWATRRLYMHCIRITCVPIPWVTIWTTSEWALSVEKICFRLSIYAYIYTDYSKNTVALINEKKSGLSCNLVASWSVQVGDMDQCLHLWKYTGGFEKIDQAKEDLWNDPEYLKLMNQRSKFLRSRHLQYLLAFSYWPQIESREGKNIYEMRQVEKEWYKETLL